MRPIFISILLGFASSGAFPSDHSSVPPAGIFDGTQWLELDEYHPLQGAGPTPLQGDAHLRNDSIVMVNVAAYRDGTRCGRSVYSFFTQAAHPDRVRVGVVQQNAPGDPDCIESFCAILASEGAGGHSNSTPVNRAERLRGGSSNSNGNDLRAEISGASDDSYSSCRWSSQVYIHRVSHLAARGPVRARAMGHKLRPLGDRNDDADGSHSFCLQTDSHVLVAPNWDCDAVRMWALTRNEFAVLTTYVPRLEELGVNLNQRWEVPVVCALSFREGIPRNAPATNAIHLTTPKLSTLWAAGFSFSKCHADVLVPTDPHLPQIFDGEEFSRGARLWTHGYDFYAPPRTILAHNYSAHATLGWDGQLGWPRDPVELGESKQRIYSLLNMPGGSASVKSQLERGGYGLGSQRTLEQYEKFVGTNLKQQRAAFHPTLEGLSQKEQDQKRVQDQEQVQQHDGGAALLTRGDTRKAAPGSELIPGGARCGTVQYFRPEPLPLAISSKPDASVVAKSSDNDRETNTQSYCSGSGNLCINGSDNANGDESVRGESSTNIQNSTMKTSTHHHESAWAASSTASVGKLSNRSVSLDSVAKSRSFFLFLAAAFFISTAGCVAWAAYLGRWVRQNPQLSTLYYNPSEINPRSIHGWA